MAEYSNLELDFDLNRDGRDIARVSVVLAFSYTRTGGDPTITEDCTSYEALVNEVDRLKGELDDALVQARKHFLDGDEGVLPDADAVPNVAGEEERRNRLRPAEGLLVRDIMTTDVKTISPLDKLSVAGELMKAGKFRHLVIVRDGEVSGVLSQRDIFYGALTWSTGQGKYAYDKALETFPVKDIMANDVVAISPDEPLSRAAVLMTEKKIGCLPVVKSGRLVGIVTEADFLALLLDR